MSLKKNKGCGKIIVASNLFGTRVKVPCGNIEEGFKPDLCDECKEITPLSGNK